MVCGFTPIVPVGCGVGLAIALLLVVYLVVCVSVCSGVFVLIVLCIPSYCVWFVFLLI